MPSNEETPVSAVGNLAEALGMLMAAKMACGVPMSESQVCCYVESVAALAVAANCADSMRAFGEPLLPQAARDVVKATLADGDDQPIDEQWLREIGFTWSDPPVGLKNGRVYVSVRDGIAVRIKLNQEVLNTTITTRRQLLALLSALGIEVEPERTA